MLTWGPGGRVETIYIIGGEGTQNLAPNSCDASSRSTVERMIDPMPGGPATWTAAASMSLSRRHAVALPLPDGRIAVIGGLGWDIPTLNCVPRRAPEIYDPGSNGWTTMKSQFESRGYHAVAFLLLDGRIVSAGGINGAHTLEIFSPTYLFRGPRPGVASVAAPIGYFMAAAPTFAVTAELGSANDPITKVSLIRPASMTHSVDFNQRYVELPIQSSTFSTSFPPGTTIQQMEVQKPEDASVCPPGWYILFAVSTQGIPSVGKFVHIP